MNIAVAQLDAGATPAENLERLNRASRQARDAEVEALFFPELYDVGYNLGQLGGEAPWCESALLKLAQMYRLFLIGGMVEFRDGRPRNTMKIFSPQGILGTYTKRHLVSFMGEKEVFEAGEELVTFEMGGLRWGCLICYDLRFPEQTRALVLEHGVEALAIVSAWPFPREQHWHTLLRARAIENQCYVVASNRVGRTGDYRFCGLSAILGPDGVPIAEADTEEETILLGELQPERVRALRRRLPILEDRRSNEEAADLEA